MGYSKGVVFFVDILGSKNRDFDKSLEIINIFQDGLKTLKKSNSFQLRHSETPVDNLFVTSFSDCTYVIYEIKKENDKEEIVLPYIYRKLFDIIDIFAFFVSNGVLCRGGIAFGELYFDKTKNIVFGPAINESYLLEQEAKMPRLIFSDELATKLIKYDKELKEKHEQAKRMNGEIILKDNIDHRYYLNYMNPFIVFDALQLVNKPFRFDSYYEQVKAKSLNAIKDEKNHDIIAKHNWHLNYLENIKNMINNFPKITVQEFIDL
jgi:hypothetical protein